MALLIVINLHFCTPWQKPIAAAPNYWLSHWTQWDREKIHEIVTENILLDAVMTTISTTVTATRIEVRNHCVVSWFFPFKISGSWGGDWSIATAKHPVSN